MVPPYIISHSRADENLDVDKLRAYGEKAVISF